MKDPLQEKIKTLERVTGWIANIDSKSSIVMALVGIFISMLFTSDFILKTLQTMIKPISKYISTGIGDFDIFITIKLIVFSFLVLFMVFTLLYLIKTLAAKTSSKQTGDNDVSTNSLIHFSSIQEKTYSEFKTSVLSETETDKLEDVLSQIYINSKRCQEKFDDYNRAIRLLRVSIMLFLIFMILIII